MQEFLIDVATLTPSALNLDVELCGRVGTLLARIHKVSADDSVPLIADELAMWTAKGLQSNAIPAEALAVLEQQRSLAAQIKLANEDSVVSRLVMCHGDVHPGNLLQTKHQGMSSTSAALSHGFSIL